MKPLTVSVSPHIHSRLTTQRVMLDVIIALLPTCISSIWLFGWRAGLVILVSVAVAVASEWCFEKIVRRPVTIQDGSAAVTGIILALLLPSSMPLWQVAIGSVVAIVIVKQLFGGLGKNFANPAVTARIVLMLAFPATITNMPMPRAAVGAVSSATPLALMAAGEPLPPMKDMLLGLHPGCMGETCIIAILIGGAYLLIRREISWQTPVGFLGTTAIIMAIAGEDVLYQLLSGGIMLGTFFLATDYVTTPTTRWGHFIFGVGCGLLSSCIRLYGNYPEGVCFAILLMNILTPYISRWTRQKPIGGGGRA